MDLDKLDKLQNLNNLRNSQTLEGIIEGLDQRGILVFQVLLGQQAMKLLSDKHVEAKTGILKPDASRT